MALLMLCAPSRACRVAPVPQQQWPDAMSQCPARWAENSRKWPPDSPEHCLESPLDLVCLWLQETEGLEGAPEGSCELRP